MEIKRIIRKLLNSIPPKIAPDIFIVGAQKAGTTALASTLSQHPMVARGSTKELAYFSRDDRYSDGIGTYRRQWPSFLERLRGRKRTYDATPEYLYHPSVAHRIYKFSPKARIIIALREPVARAYSAWNMYSQYRDQVPPHPIFSRPVTDRQRAICDTYKLSNDHSFRAVVQTELDLIQAGNALLEPGIVRRGIYAPQVARYFETFGRENVLVLFSSELKEHSEAQLDRVAKFLDLDRAGFPSSVAPTHVRSYGSRISEEDKNFLEGFYAEHNQELKQLLGCETLPW